MYKCYTIFLNQNFTRNPIKQKRIQNFDGKTVFSSHSFMTAGIALPVFLSQGPYPADCDKKITQNLSIISVRPSFLTRILWGIQKWGREYQILMRNCLFWPGYGNNPSEFWDTGSFQQHILHKGNPQSKNEGWVT